MTNYLNVVFFINFMIDIYHAVYEGVMFSIS
jgi:hypothetical protein